MNNSNICTPKSILLVEDDLDDQEFFIEAISQIENVNMYAVANNGKEALDKLENPTIYPDMIFMDINMPMMNGLECLTEIIKNPRISNIPVVILSTGLSEKNLVYHMGARAFIEKPSNGNLLKSQIESMINLTFIENSVSTSLTFDTRPSAS